MWAAPVLSEVDEMAEQIYEEGEYCAICLGVENLGLWYLKGTDAEGKTEPFSLTICNPCYADKAALQMWLAKEMEKALERDPTMERLPDGRWKRKNTLFAQEPTIEI